MSHKLIRSIFLLLLFVVAANGQPRRDSPSLKERAQGLEPLIIKAAMRYGLDARLLRAVCFIESRFRTDAVSPKGARGPMQFIPETAARYGLTNPHDPKAAMDAAARYLRDLLKKFNGRVDLAVAAYNAGEGAVESFRTGKPLVLRTGKVINSRRLMTGGIPPYRETQAYVNQIMRLLASPYPRSAETSIPNTAEKTSPPIKTRDFTLDVLSSIERTSIKRAQQMNSSFIEIDVPH